MNTQNLVKNIQLQGASKLVSGMVEKAPEMVKDADTIALTKKSISELKGNIVALESAIALAENPPAA